MSFASDFEALALILTVTGNQSHGGSEFTGIKIMAGGGDGIGTGGESLEARHI